MPINERWGAEIFSDDPELVTEGFLDSIQKDLANSFAEIEQEDLLVKKVSIVKTDAEILICRTGWKFQPRSRSR